MFGNRLKDLRTQNGYSMDKLIELYNAKYDAKMNKSTLSRYENGLQEPIYTVVVNLADFFNVSVDYLSGNQPDDNYLKNNRQLTNSELSIRKKEFIQKVENMTDAQIERLEQILALVQQTEL